MSSILRRNSHEVAALYGEPILVGELENRCGKDSGHPRAQKVVNASKSGALRCIVCGARLACVFGRRNRWYFRSAGCDHEWETLDARLARAALLNHFRATLDRSWSVEAAVLVDTHPGLRPDLYLEAETGVRLAFELQHSEITGSELAERRETYRRADILDVWMLVSHNVGSRLMRTMAETEGQRPLVISGWTEDIREAIPTFIDSGDFLTPTSPWQMRADHLNPERENFTWIDYPIEELGLTKSSELITPADGKLEPLILECQRRAFLRAWDP